MDVTILSFCNYKLYHVTDVLFINLVKFSFFAFSVKAFLLSHERNWKYFVRGMSDDLNNKFLKWDGEVKIDGKKFMSVFYFVWDLRKVCLKSF